MKKCASNCFGWTFSSVCNGYKNGGVSAAEIDTHRYTQYSWTKYNYKVR